MYEFWGLKWKYMSRSTFLSLLFEKYILHTATLFQYIILDFRNHFKIMSYLSKITEKLNLLNTYQESDIKIEQIKKFKNGITGFKYP